METLRIPGLSRLEGLELKKRFPDADISFDSSSGSDEVPGELLTMGVIVLTLAGLKALAAYLTMDKRTGRIERTVEIVGKKGVRRKEKLVVDIDERTSHSDVLKQVAEMMHVDLSALK